MSDPLDRLRSLVRDVPDFPKPGVVFKDLTPAWADARCFATIVDSIVDPHAGDRIDKVLGIEARGFILAAPAAYRLGAGFVPARKRGKLPWQTNTVTYELEYGSESLELHQDAVGAGDRVLIVDDVLATGGTAAAAVSLVTGSGAEVAGFSFVLELGFLSGREKLPGLDIHTLLTY
ncbi:MAG TPA: adenine phosphoribosyltransferase [Actinomycetota bacterium]|nr:adenine phosphoribosyltransferase [Actinomycetota bacterium]